MPSPPRRTFSLAPEVCEPQPSTAMPFEICLCRRNTATGSWLGRDRGGSGGARGSGARASRTRRAQVAGASRARRGRLAKGEGPSGASEALPWCPSRAGELPTMHIQCDTVVVVVVVAVAVCSAPGAGSYKVQSLF